MGLGNVYASTLSAVEMVLVGQVEQVFRRSRDSNIYLPAENLVEPRNRISRWGRGWLADTKM